MAGLFDDILAPERRPRKGLFDDVLEPAGTVEIGPIETVATARPAGIGETLGDTFHQFRTGVAEAVPALADAPRRALNLLTGSFLTPAGSPRQTETAPPVDTFADAREALRIDMPDAQRQWADETAGRVAAYRAANLSDAAKAANLELEQAAGVLGTIETLVENPRILANEGARMVGNMAPGMGAGVVARGLGAAPATGAGVTLGTLGGTFGGMTAQQVEATLLQAPPELTGPLIAQFRERVPMAQGWDDAQVLKALSDARATEAFGLSAAVNTVLPLAIPGGMAVERAIARVPAAFGTRRGANAVSGALGEGATEMLQGGADQVIQNVYTEQPTYEGVGKAAVLEGILGGVLGGPAGALRPIAAESGPVPRETPDTSIQPAPDIRPEDTADLDELLVRNIPPEVVEAAAAELGLPPEALGEVAGEVLADPDARQAVVERLFEADARWRPPTAASTAQSPAETAGSRPAGGDLASRRSSKEYLAEIKAAQARGSDSPRETITPADDKFLGDNIDGHPLYERADGSRYIMRNNRPDFGGFLFTEAEAAPEIGGDVMPAVAPTPRPPVTPPVPTERREVPRQDEPPPDRLGPTMQNRDRSRTASVAQMRDIARDPDPERLGFSRDPNTGAPMVGQGREIPEADLGRTDSVVMASGRRVPVRYAVVEASDLAASHDASGAVNPEYDAAPLKALNNGRTAGLQAAWAAGKADRYRQGIAADAALHGVPEAAIAGKRNPVLVRLYDPALNTGDMGAESNATQQLGLSPVEQAQTDARSLPDTADLKWNEDGSLPAAGNVDFFRRWFRNMGETQAASLQDAQGRPNAAAMQRLRAALVGRAYGDERVLAALAEDVNPDNRNILNAMAQAAPAFATLETDSLAGEIRDGLVGGLELVREASNQGQTLEKLLEQGDLMGRNPAAVALARYMVANARSARRMADAFRAMAEYADRAQRQAANLDVFGGPPQATIGDALNAAGIEQADAGTAAAGDAGRNRVGEPAGRGRAAAGDAFALEAESAPEPARQEVAPAAGLFGAPTTQDLTDDARRRRDAERDGRTGTGRTDMAAGDGELFAGRRPEQARVDEPLESTEPAPTADEIASFARQREQGQARETQRQAATELSRQRGEADADANGLRAAVDAVIGGAKVPVRYLRGQDGLQGLVTPGFIAQLQSQQRGRANTRTAGLYITAQQSADGKPFVVIFTDVATTPAIAAWTGAHEVSGHHGVRSLLGKALDPALAIADQNPTVKAVADSMMAQREMAPGKRMLAVEEALADLNAAIRTGDFDKIRTKHGVEVPAAMRSRLRAAIDNFLRRLRALLNRALPEGAAFTDAQVRTLLDDAFAAARSGQAVGLEVAADGAVRESTDADQTQTPVFRRWFGDSKVVDADGRPLVVYHGSGTNIEAFDPTLTGQGNDQIGSGFYFTTNREEAEGYTTAITGNAREGARKLGGDDSPTVVEAFLSIKNPIAVNGSNLIDTDVDLTAAQAEAIIRRAPKLRDEDDSPMGNWHDIWSVGGVQDWMIRDVAPNYAGPSLISLENDWFRGDAGAFRAALRDILGFDGVVQRFDNGTAHWVAWFPEQIKSATSNRGTFDPDSPSILESVDYTPAQEAALAKAGLPVDRRTTLQRVGDGIREEWSKLREAARDSDALKQATFDRFHGLRMAEAQVGLADPETSPYIAARMTAGLSSNLEALMLYGAPELDGGVLTIKDGTVGLLDALAPVKGSLDQWLGWMVGRRAQVLKRQGRENNLSDADIDALLSLADGRQAAFQQAATDYLKIKNAVLDIAEQAGVVDPEARAAWDHAEYIPFYRAETEGYIGPGTRKSLSGQTSGIRTLKGGESALADPLANIVRNFTKLLDASLKNRAALMAVDQLGSRFFEPAAREFQPATIPLDQVKKHLAEQGVPDSTIDGMPKAALRGVQRMLSIVPPTGEDVVRVMRAGKPEYYRALDPLVLRSMTAFKPPNKNIAMRPLIWFKRLLTTGVTTTAEFVGANFIRDSASAWVISDDRFIPGWDSLRGVGNTLRNDAGTREMMMSGSTFLGGHFYDGDPSAAAAALRRALRQKGLQNEAIEGFMGTVARSPLQLWDSWMRLSGAIENANRRAVFEAAIRAGRTRTEAAFMARDLMDFAMQGDAAWVQFFADVLPFFNARLQGLYKLGRRAGTKEGKRAIILRGGVLTLASVALYAWNILAHGDAWDELEEWDKDAYWHIAPGTEFHARIPKPFEIGLVFGTIPERAMEAIRYANTGEGDKPKATWDALVRAITGTLAFNPIPQAALPLAEQWANKRFFTGRPIESMGDESLLPEARGEWYTSDTMKALGRMSGLSPKRLEHLWNGYTAGLGGYVLDASDAVVRMVQDSPAERPARSLAETPVVGRFLRGGSPGRSKYTEQFYTALREAEQHENTIKDLLVKGETEEAEAMIARHVDLLGARGVKKSAKAGIEFARPKRLRKVRSELTDLREEIETIVLDTKMSAEQKREAIDKLEARRNRLVRDAVKFDQVTGERLSVPENMRANYRQALEQQGMAGPEIARHVRASAIHHIIPDNLARSHPVMVAARAAGYDLDRASNLVGLAKERSAATDSGAELGHWTFHPKYDKEVAAQLDAAKKRLEREHGTLHKAPKPAVLEAVREVEQAMRERIERRDVPTKGGRLAAVPGARRSDA